MMAYRAYRWRRSVESPQPAGWRSALSAAAGLLLLLAACAAPVQVDRVDLRSAYDELNRTALSSDQLSEVTRTVLRRAALLDDFDAQPDAAIVALRAQAIASGMPWPDLYALSEMSYYEGRRTKSKAMLLASALYAYAVLFPAGDAAWPSPYSQQFLHAADFYNLALTQVLSGEGADGVANLQSGRYEVPFGVVDVAVDQANLQFAGRTLTSFVPTMNLTVKGFQNDYRSEGLGAPLAAGLAPASQPDKGLVLPATLRIPTSAVLQMDDPRRQLTGSEMTARLSLYTIYDTADIRIDGHTVPLEYDQTAVRACSRWRARVGPGNCPGCSITRRSAQTAQPTITCLRWSRTATGVSPWCWCMALPPARSAGATWSTTCWKIRKSAIVTSSGSSHTIPAIRSRCPPTCCAIRSRTLSNPSAAFRPTPRSAAWW
jgi:hypothetical protein